MAEPLAAEVAAFPLALGQGRDGPVSPRWGEIKKKNGQEEKKNMILPAPATTGPGLERWSFACVSAGWSRCWGGLRRSSSGCGSVTVPMSSGGYLKRVSRVRCSAFWIFIARRSDPGKGCCLSGRSDEPASSLGDLSFQSITCAPKAHALRDDCEAYSYVNYDCRCT